MNVYSAILKKHEGFCNDFSLPRKLCKKSSLSKSIIFNLRQNQKSCKTSLKMKDFEIQEIKLSDSIKSLGMVPKLIKGSALHA